MRRMKLHKMIEHLKAKGFYHDAQDFEDGVENVLADYGIDEEFSYEELREIERDLMVVAELNELYEIERVVNETDGAQPSVSSSDRPGALPHHLRAKDQMQKKDKEKAKAKEKAKEKKADRHFLPSFVEEALGAMHCEEI